MQHRNRVFGQQDREKWKRDHPENYKASMSRRKQKEKDDPETKLVRSRANRDSKCKKAYGITLEQKEQRIAAQDFRCANPGCRSTDPHGKGWVSDHSHKTGKLRGELCNCCNVALGMVHDDLVVLDGLMRYLRFYE
jgi:hypothetical protein